MADFPLVSLIMVTYNSAPALPACFAALAQTTYPGYEVLVVDNASRDDSVRYLREEQPNVRLLAHQTNLGFGCACNQGAQLAQGDFLLFLNPDVIVTPDWLQILVQHMADYPDAAIICPTTLNSGEQPRTASLTVEEVAAVPGCAMMVRRTAWQAIGGFDEAIFMYWEDIELCWRAWLAGWRVLADLQAQVYHERGASSGTRRWDAELTKNGLYTYLKLMRWRRVAPFVAEGLAKTVVKFLLRPNRDLLRAWLWNMRHLPQTLARRRAFARIRTQHPADLERRVVVYQHRMRRERRARDLALRAGTVGAK